MKQSELFLGAWENGYGSLLELNTCENNTIEGRFLTKVGRAETKQIWADQWFKVVGRCTESLISFIISYETSGAIASNVGRISVENGEQKIYVQGLFITDVPEDQRWRQVIATQGVFHKISGI